MSNIQKVLLVDCNANEDFFDKWIEYLTPKHHLTRAEQKLLAACLRTRHELSKVIKDENILDETCLNETYRSKIKKDLSLSNQQFLNLIGRLKKLKILIPRYAPYSEKVAYYKISPSFIPPYVDGEEFKLLLLFKEDVRGDIQTGSEGVQSTGENSEESLRGMVSGDTEDNQ